jgi:hypothetical protein
LISVIRKGHGNSLTRTQNLDHFITYSVINTEPELTYSSVVSTIRCWPVTSGEFEDSTFVRWTSKFSSDADLGRSSVEVLVFFPPA